MMHGLDRPETTLFMLVSVDGKISTGDTDVLDVDVDFPKIKGVREGLAQYYGLQDKTDPFNMESGRTMAKVGINGRSLDAPKLGISFVVIDNKPHLTLHGVDYFLRISKMFYLVTTNKSHPAFQRRGADNLEIIHYEGGIDFADLFARLKRVYGIPRLTIQGGGILNATLLRNKLIDHVSIVVAPVLIGGKGTVSLIDGEPLHAVVDLPLIKALVLKKCDVLNDSYLHLQYDVINETVVEDRH